MNCWLMKSESAMYSIDDLKKDGKTYWDGVRNYQARNFMRDTMKTGDQVLFYHSNAEPSGVAGIAEVCKEGYPDFSAWDNKDSHFDPRSTKEKPLWFMVDLKFTSKFKNFISLEYIKSQKSLKGIMVAQRGSRLSVQPVEKRYFEIIKEMGAAK